MSQRLRCRAHRRSGEVAHHADTVARLMAEQNMETFSLSEKG